MQHQKKDPGAVAAALGADIQADQTHYGPAGASAQLRSLWLASFAERGSMLRTRRFFGLEPPPCEAMDRHLHRGYRVLALRDIGLCVSASGSVLLPLYARDRAVLEVQAWKGWTERYSPHPAACRLGIDDFADIPCEAPFAAVLEVASDGRVRLHGDAGSIIHAHPNLIGGRQVLAVRIDPRAWLRSVTFDESQRGAVTAHFPAAFILQAKAVEAVAEALLAEGPLAEIRVMDPSHAALFFARRLDIEVKRQRLGRAPVVTVARDLECVP